MSQRIMFVIFAAVVTIIALLSNYAANKGYGNIFTPSEHEHHDTYYYRNDNRNNSVSDRKPWTMQKPSSKPSSSHSSKSSHSSGHK